ncbi:MAG TPA: hypothetical protein VG253_02340 [Streptosporangiaceae bacterium]|jgi:hypothetical protein|nr:hypothetical protein [Streptosporangiaceae bacterium]
MSSITDPRLAMIGAAIDELAEASRAASSTPGNSSPGSGTPGVPDASGTMAERVARIWAMVADLDPGLAQRLPGYTDQHQQDRQGPPHRQGPRDQQTPRNTTHD